MKIKVPFSEAVNLAEWVEKHRMPITSKISASRKVRGDDSGFRSITEKMGTVLHMSAEDMLGHVKRCTEIAGAVDFLKSLPEKNEVIMDHEDLVSLTMMKRMAQKMAREMT